MRSNLPVKDWEAESWELFEECFMVMSWRLATMFYGPDDGTDDGEEERNTLECEIQQVMKDALIECGVEPTIRKYSGVTLPDGRMMKTGEEAGQSHLNPA